MRARRVLVPVIVVAIVTIGTVVPVLAIGGGDHAATGDDAAENTTGVQLTAYMQTTAAETNASVETGMWAADINSSANPDNKIRQQATSLEQRLENLRNRTKALKRLRANGSLPPVVYNARAAVVQAQIAGLEQAINATAQAAERFGVNVTRLDELRSQASNMTGPEVAAIAQNLTAGGTPPWAGNGSADGAQGNESGPGDAGNESRPGDSAGNESRTGDGSGNESRPGDGGAGNGTSGDGGAADGGAGDGGSDGGAGGDGGGAGGGTGDGGAGDGGGGANPLFRRAT